MRGDVKSLKIYLESNGKDFEQEVAGYFEEVKEGWICDILRNALDETLNQNNAEAVYHAIVNLPEIGPALQKSIRELVLIDMADSYKHLVANWFAKNRQ